MDILRKFLLVSLLSLWAHPGFAINGMLGDDLNGQVDSVDLENRTIIINDWVFRLSLDLKVHGAKGLETDFALKRGQSVRYELDPKSLGRNTRTIVDIWLLPDDGD